MAQAKSVFHSLARHRARDAPRRSLRSRPRSSTSGVLLYDHAGFGRSDGESRQRINLWAQARGYQDALRFAANLDCVDASRLAVWGDSLASGIGLVVAAVDDRVAAAVALALVCGEQDPPQDPKGKLYAALRQTLLDGDITSHATRVGPMPVVSFDQRGTPSFLTPLTAFRWFIDYGAVFGTGWENVATYEVPATPAPFSVGLAVPHLRVPSLWVMCPTDELPQADPTIARKAYDSATGEKELFEIDVVTSA